MKMYHTMAIIDSISEIQEIFKDPDITNLEIKLVGTPANQNYPCVRIFINHNRVLDDYIIDEYNVALQLENIAQQIHILIEYYNKTDKDTIVDNGVIIGNQCVCIDQLTINGAKILGDSLANISNVNYRLTEDQKTIYNKHGYKWENVSSNSLYNNGTLEICLNAPFVTNLLNGKNVILNKFEISHTDVLNKLQKYFKE